MFWNTKRDNASKYNALNPRCAPVFHALVESLPDKMRSDLSSEAIFEDSKVRRQLDGDYTSCAAARADIGSDKACENVVMQLMGGMFAIEQHHGKDSFAHVMGFAGSIPIIRRVVFGFAPGLSDGSDSEAFSTTVYMLSVLVALLQDAPEDSCLSGSREAMVGFLQVCEAN